MPKMMMLSKGTMQLFFGKFHRFINILQTIGVFLKCYSPDLDRFVLNQSCEARLSMNFSPYPMTHKQREQMMRHHDSGQLVLGLKLIVKFSVHI